MDDSLRNLLPILYATPLDPSNWHLFLDLLSQYIDIASGYLISSNAKTGNLCLAGGGTDFNPEVLTLYNEHFADNDPFRAAFLTRPRTGLIPGEELVRPAELRKTELWNELLLPNQLHHVTMLCGTCDRGHIETLSLWRNAAQGSLNRPSFELLEALAPHIQSVLQLKAQLQTAGLRDSLLETALDALEMMVILVNEAGRVLHLNTSASAHLPAMAAIMIRSGRLVASNPQEDARLQELIRRATTRGPEHAGGAMKIRTAPSTPEIQLSVVPTLEGSSMARIHHTATIFLYDPQSTPRLRARFMRQVYDLTATEARLADCLLEGKDLRDAAEQLSITWSTARFHLKRVFAKTGTRRQVELMRLMLAIPATDIRLPREAH